VLEGLELRIQAHVQWRVLTIPVLVGDARQPRCRAIAIPFIEEIPHRIITLRDLRLHIRSGAQNTHPEDGGKKET
jgi:hypothetical protein